MENQREYIINNLHLSNKELSDITGMSQRQIKYYLFMSGITRTSDQLQAIMTRKGSLQAGTNNPNWKNGISSDNYHYKKTQMERFPEKIEARRQVHIAIKRGILVRQPCEVCGDPKSEGHHTDHSKPLEVIWLCRQHHREIEKLESLKRDTSRESDSVSKLKCLQITGLEVIHTNEQLGNQYLMEF